MAAAAAALALCVAGCGSDDEPGQRTAGAGETTAGATSSTPATSTAPGKNAATATTEASKPKKKKAPESQPGGAGDEEPARSQALLTGRAGRISPRLVQVPPFISVRVELRSADGRGYSVRIAGHTLRAGGGLGSTSTTLDGLRPGRSYAGRGSDGGRLRVEASAEPGP